MKRFLFIMLSLLFGLIAYGIYMDIPFYIEFHGDDPVSEVVGEVVANVTDEFTLPEAVDLGLGKETITGPLAQELLPDGYSRLLTGEPTSTPLEVYGWIEAVYGAYQIGTEYNHVGALLPGSCYEVEFSEKVVLYFSHKEFGADGLNYESSTVIETGQKQFCMPEDAPSTWYNMAAVSFDKVN